MMIVKMHYPVQDTFLPFFQSCRYSSPQKASIDDYNKSNHGNYFSGRRAEITRPCEEPMMTAPRQSQRVVFKDGMPVFIQSSTSTLHEKNDNYSSSNHQGDLFAGRNVVSHYSHESTVGISNNPLGAALGNQYHPEHMRCLNGQTSTSFASDKIFSPPYLGFSDIQDDLSSGDSSAPLMRFGVNPITSAMRLSCYSEASKAEGENSMLSLLLPEQGLNVSEQTPATSVSQPDNPVLKKGT